MSFESFNSGEEENKGGSLKKIAVIAGLSAGVAAGLTSKFSNKAKEGMPEPEQGTKQVDQQAAQEKSDKGHFEQPYSHEETRSQEIRDHFQESQKQNEALKQAAVSFLADKGIKASVDDISDLRIIHNKIPIDVKIKGEKIKITTADYTNRELEELRGVMQEKLKAIDTPSVQQNFQVHAEYVRERNILREIGIEESSQEQRAAPASQEKPSSTRQGTNLDNVKDW